MACMLPGIDIWKSQGNISSLSLSFISSIISSISFLPFSRRQQKMTHKGWLVIKTQQINQYSWARSAILVAGTCKGRRRMFLSLLFLHNHSCSSFFPDPLFYLLYYLFCFFSPFFWETTQNDPQGLTCH